MKQGGRRSIGVTLRRWNDRPFRDGLGLSEWRWSYERAVSRRRDANAAAAAAANMDDVSLLGSPALVRASR